MRSIPGPGAAAAQNCRAGLNGTIVKSPLFIKVLVHGKDEVAYLAVRQVVAIEPERYSEGGEHHDISVITTVHDQSFWIRATPHAVIAQIEKAMQE